MGLYQAKTLFLLRYVMKIVLKLTKSASSMAQLQNKSIFIEKDVLSNLTMLVMEILPEIVIQFSFDMTRIFASFSGHTLSNRGPNKSPFDTSQKYWRYGFYEGQKFTIVFIANIKTCFAEYLIDKHWTFRFCDENHVLLLKA